MDSALLTQAVTLLAEVLDLLDQAQAPSDLGARLSEVIERIRLLNP